MNNIKIVCDAVEEEHIDLEDLLTEDAARQMVEQLIMVKTEMIKTLAHDQKLYEDEVAKLLAAIKTAAEDYDALYKRYQFLGQSVVVLLRAHPEFYRQIFTTTTCDAIAKAGDAFNDGTIIVGVTPVAMVCRELNISNVEAKPVVEAIVRHLLK